MKTLPTYLHVFLDIQVWFDRITLVSPPSFYLGDGVDSGFFIFLAFWLLFFLVVRSPLFGLGRGAIIPPGPAMVVIDRKDLN